MQIHLDTSSADRDELTALIALLSSLGGRLPDGLIAPTVEIGAELRLSTRGQIEQFAGRVERAAPSTPADAAEALLAHAAATRTAPPPPSTGPLALDPDGIPWDDRIHASTKSTNADGRWTKKRKVDEVLYGQVFAELQERYAPTDDGSGVLSDGSVPNDGTGITNGAAGPNGSDTVATPAPPPPASDAPTVSAAPPPPTADVPNDAANAPTAPPPLAAENAPGAGRFASFPDFVAAVNTLIAPSGKSYTYVELATFSQMFGAAGFKDMKDKPDDWAAFYETAGGQ